MSVEVRCTQVASIASFNPADPGVTPGTLVVETSTDSVYVVRVNGAGVRSLALVLNGTLVFRDDTITPSYGAPASGEITLTGVVTNLAGLPAPVPLLVSINCSGAALTVVGVVGTAIILDGGATAMVRVMPNVAGVWSLLMQAAPADTLTVSVDGLGGAITTEEFTGTAP